MESVRNIIAALAAGVALSFGAAAFAQDSQKPQQTREQAKDHQHRGGDHRHEGMQGMRGMGHGGGGCHNQS